MEGVDKGYLWVKGNNKFRIAFADYKTWIKQDTKYSSISWFAFASYKQHKDGKVLHLTFFGFNIAYLFAD